MENASKALLIAGGMLIMILIMTFSAITFRKIQQQTSEFHKEMSETEIFEFNQKLFNYDGASNLIFQDIVTISNYVRNSNLRGIAPVEIKVKIDDTYLDLDKSDSEWKKWISDNLKENMENRYKCKVNYADKSEYVGEIIIEKNMK